MNVPVDLDAEWGAVADVISKNGEGGQSLVADLFTDEGAGKLAEIIRSLIAAGAPVMVETVSRSCNDHGLIAKLSESGGPGIGYWLPLLREKRALRAIQLTALKIQSAVGRLEPEKRPVAEEIGGLLSEAAADLAAVGLSLDEGKRVSMRDNVENFIAALEAADKGDKPPTITTGLPAMDRILGGGLRMREMAVIGARTSVGKSALAVWITKSACAAGKSVLYASKEMGQLSLTARFTSAESGIALRTHEGTSGLSARDRQALISAAGRIKKWKLHLRDDLRSIAAVRAEAAALKPDLVVIDHLGIFDSGLSGKASLYDKATANSNAARDLAFETGAAVIALCQVNRAGADEEKPRLDHLKGTGAIEEDARVVFLMHRVEKLSHEAHKLELNLAKNTDGPLRVQPLLFDAARCTFTEDHDLQP